MNFSKTGGMPIGNLTSQIFANIYLNELDQFVKQQLKVKYYFRYADDFVVVHNSIAYLENIKLGIEKFLSDKIKLSLHPGKVETRKFTQGIDFLGYVILPHHIVLRTKTKRRMFKKLYDKHNLVYDGLIENRDFYQSVQSYLGMLKHCSGYNTSTVIKNSFLSNLL